mmetsp:Transcript_106366/g.305796  ORF Transcript_106366/g.305796 Transcript_106366/m.305796 type:complete len:221 (+) Transcript_106366:187-849(+)
MPAAPATQATTVARGIANSNAPRKLGGRRHSRWRARAGEVHAAALPRRRSGVPRYGRRARVRAGRVDQGVQHEKQKVEQRGVDIEDTGADIQDEGRPHAEVGQGWHFGAAAETPRKHHGRRRLRHCALPAADEGRGGEFQARSQQRERRGQAANLVRRDVCPPWQQRQGCLVRRILGGYGAVVVGLPSLGGAGVAEIPQGWRYARHDAPEHALVPCANPR